MRTSEKVLELAESLNVLVTVLYEQKLTASDKAQLRTALQYLFGAINIINKILNGK